MNTTATKAATNQNKRTYAADKLSPKTRALLHKAISKGIHAAAGQGIHITDYDLTATENAAAHPEKKAALTAALMEAEKRAYSALATWHRYALVEADNDTATLRTPAQLDPATGQWGGIFYGLSLTTGICSCPDHDSHVKRINQRLSAHAPEAAPITCKHFIVLAIMAANKELTLPERAEEAQTETTEDDRNQEAALNWEIWYHDGDPERARLYAHSLTHAKAAKEAEAAQFTSNQRPRSQAPYREFYIKINDDQTQPENTTKTRNGDF